MSGACFPGCPKTKNGRRTSWTRLLFQYHNISSVFQLSRERGGSDAEEGLLPKRWMAGEQGRGLDTLTSFSGVMPAPNSCGRVENQGSSSGKLLVVRRGFRQKRKWRTLRRGRPGNTGATFAWHGRGPCAHCWMPTKNKKPQSLFYPGDDWYTIGGSNPGHPVVSFKYYFILLRGIGHRMLP